MRLVASCVAPSSVALTPPASATRITTLPSPATLRWSTASATSPAALEMIWPVAWMPSFSKMNSAPAYPAPMASSARGSAVLPISCIRARYSPIPCSAAESVSVPIAAPCASAEAPATSGEPEERPLVASMATPAGTAVPSSPPSCPAGVSWLAATSRDSPSAMPRACWLSGVSRGVCVAMAPMSAAGLSAATPGVSGVASFSAAPMRSAPPRAAVTVES